MKKIIRLLITLVLAAITAIPLTFVLAIILTPILWWLEGKIGIELAGHSGPADWVIETIWGCITLLLFLFVLWINARKKKKQPSAKI